MKTVLKYLISVFVSIYPGLASSEVLTDLKIKSVLFIKVESSINPATFEYLKSAEQKAKSSNSDVILMQINTPGGLVSTTKKIITLMGESSIPFIVWVGPEGGSATSAGALISSAAHGLFMAPGTSIGSATPVSLGFSFKEDSENDDMKKKSVNDLTSLVSSLSQARNRPSQPFELMISEAKSYTAIEALKAGILNGIANSPTRILEKLQDTNIYHQQMSKRVLISKDVKLETYDMTTGQTLLNILSDPSLAYILFVLGAALFYFEMQAATGYLAGAVGTISFILSAIGFQLLPVNLGSLFLIFLSFVLFFIETLIPSFGLLLVAGLGSLLMGSLFLFKSDDSLLLFRNDVVFTVVGSVGSFLAIVTAFLAWDMKKQKDLTIEFSMKNKKAKVLGLLNVIALDNKDVYQIKVDGEVWRAFGPPGLQEGQYVEILGHSQDHLTLEIKSLKEV